MSGRPLRVMVMMIMKRTPAEDHRYIYIIYISANRLTRHLLKFTRSRSLRTSPRSRSLRTTLQRSCTHGHTRGVVESRARDRDLERDVAVDHALLSRLRCRW